MSYILPEIIKIGGVLKNRKIEQPLFIPKNDFNGITYGYDSYNKETIKDLLEYCVLNLIKEIGVENIKVNIIDFTITRKYQNLNQFRKEEFFKYINKNNLSLFLNEIENRVTEINEDYLLDEFQNICDYNINNLNDLLEYNIIILNFDNFKVNNESDYQSILNLLKHGRESGVIFIINVNLKDFENELNKINQDNYSSETNRFKLLCFLRSKLSILYQNEKGYNIINTKPQIIKPELGGVKKNFMMRFYVKTNIILIKFH